MTTAYVGLGANLGDRMFALAAAVDLLAREDGIEVRRVSRVYETEPVGPAQPRFLNAVVELDSMLSSRALVQRFQAIEEKLGRVRRERWGPREIDLDLLLLGTTRVATPLVVVPHPRLHERAFVLAPLYELAPDLQHPVLGSSIRALLGAIPEPHGVRLVGPLRRRGELPEEEPEIDPNAPPKSSA